MLILMMIVVGLGSFSVPEFVVILLMSMGVHLITGAPAIVVTVVESGVPIVRGIVGRVIRY